MGSVEQFKDEVEAADPDADKPMDTMTGDAPSEALRNSPSWKSIAAEIEKIEGEQTEIDAISDKASEEKAPYQDAISKLKTDLKENHPITTKELSIILTERRQTRRIAARKAALEEEQRDNISQIEMAFEG